VGVGAERGLGAALCRRFAQGGYHVLVAGRTAAKINKVAETIISAGGSAEPVATDATLEQDVVRLFDRAMAPGDGFEPTDLVVSNAGNNRRIDFRELTAEQFEDFWRVGCFSGFLVGREAARRLASLGRGTIIFTGASASIRGKPGFAHFSAAKAGTSITAVPVCCHIDNAIVKAITLAFRWRDSAGERHPRDYPREIAADDADAVVRGGVDGAAEDINRLLTTFGGSP
jgi:NADP-dependent 3-hydroxy acid dehydrogenase YdfG